jgi:hypothetical protein
LTPATLHALCASLNDANGRGGKTELARRLDWDYSTLWRKLEGKTKITRADELAVYGAMKASPPRGVGPR